MAEIGTDVEKAVKFLRHGKLVAMPTETVYGLAANALNEDAVVSIFEAKQRPFFDPLIVHISSADAVSQYASNVPDIAYDLMERFWPGPLTILLPKKPLIPDIVTAGQPTVGLRVPAQSFTLQMLSMLDFPLAAPSANPFGYISPTRPQHVQEMLGDKVSYILDGGDCSLGIESTIIGFDNDIPTLYRLGGLPSEEIETITGPLKKQISQSSNPMSPGQLKSHYAPRTSLLFKKIEEEDLKRKGRIGVIRFDRPLEGPIDTPFKQWILSPSADMHEAARNLFHFLREADQAGLDLILAEPVPQYGLGPAINDRLRRASA